MIDKQAVGIVNLIDTVLVSLNIPSAFNGGTNLDLSINITDNY